MSQFTQAAGTGTSTVLIAPTLSMLNGMVIAGDLTDLELHDCAAVGDVAASNSVWKLSGAGLFGQGFQQNFEGVMFMKGIVVVFTASAPVSTFTSNFEWE